MSHDFGHLQPRDQRPFLAEALGAMITIAHAHPVAWSYCAGLLEEDMGYHWGYHWDRGLFDGHSWDMKK